MLERCPCGERRGFLGEGGEEEGVFEAAVGARVQDRRHRLRDDAQEGGGSLYNVTVSYMPQQRRGELLYQQHTESLTQYSNGLRAFRFGG